MFAKTDGQRADEGLALWYVAPGRAELRSEPVASPGPGEVRVRALYGALSRGTEALVFGGRVPASEHQRMRAPYMAGDFPFPVKYGYSTVGIVEMGPESLLGRNVFALHPHQSVFTLPADAVVIVPEKVPPSRAVLGANMETALNAVWDAMPGPADRVAVVGAGVVGVLVAWLIQHMPGTEVTLIDIDPSRGPLAQSLGIDFTLGSGPQDCDVVVHASASAAGLAKAIDLAGEEATIVELSWYGIGEVAVPLGGVFHSRRLKIVSSQVGRVAASHRPRWTHRRRLSAALALLEDARLDRLLADPIAFTDLPDHLPRILARQSGILCQVIEYPTN